MNVRNSLLLFFLLSGHVCAQIALDPSKSLDINAWQGASVKNDILTISVPGNTVYTVPDGPVRRIGFRVEDEGTLDLRNWYGLRFDINLDNDDVFVLKTTLSIREQRGRKDLLEKTASEIRINGKGWQTITVPFQSFDYNRGQAYMLGAIKTIALNGHYESNTKGTVRLRQVYLTKGNVIQLASDIRSKPGETGDQVPYPFTVTNCSKKMQLLSLNIQKDGWEAMKTALDVSSLVLQPGESNTVTLTVTIPDDIPAGAQEKQQLVVSTTDGSQTERMEFITLKRLPSPFLVHDAKGWEAVKEKVQHYEWARIEAERYIRESDAFKVPLPGAGTGKGVFNAYIERQLWPCAVAWKLTGEKKHAEKIALFLKRLSDPEKGYPKTYQANNSDIPQEGELWQRAAQSYDMIQDADVLTSEEKQQIERSFRLFINEQVRGLKGGGISNWSVFNLLPAANCALLLHDMVSFNALMYEPTGIIDHLRYGAMDDGWWYEVSLSYNIECAIYYTKLGLAAKPFGINLLNADYPASLTRNVGLRPFEYEAFLGMAFGKFGPFEHNTVNIKRMWDGIAPYPDYRGVMFGMGDGHEQLVSGGDFELAYYAFRDPAYATIIKQGYKRDLIYGVPELPENTPELYKQSAHSDNAGVAVLRSQTEGREQREQLQAAMKYGTHGSYHGHFDRLSLLSLMRYGRSFWNPETSWFGYASYMYKWWVQASMAHNMVVADGKMQEPKETTSLLFHSGKMMQVIAMETNARWSNPPYLGGYEQLQGIRDASINYATIPENHPKPGDVTGYTEPILQRRLMVVTDDYVLLADYLKAENEHTFDQLLHLRGAEADKELIFKDYENQFDTSPLSSGQFITGVSTYSTENGALIHSRLVADRSNSWQKGGFDGYQEPGLLYIDVYHAWPLQGEVRIGNYAEGVPVSKKLVYTIQGDNKVLKTDSLRTWILGYSDVDMDVKGIKILKLTSGVERNNNLKTLFWDHARIVTSTGKEIPLSELTVQYVNSLQPKKSGEDYAGGNVKIAGKRCMNVLPAEPENQQAVAEITLDLSSLDAVRFKAGIGGDYPVGDEDQARKTTSYRVKGKEVSYLSVLEPYERKKLISRVKAVSTNSIIIELTDGRVQEITLQSFNCTNEKPQVTMKEVKGGLVTKEETTISNQCSSSENP